MRARLVVVPLVLGLAIARQAAADPVPLAHRRRSHTSDEFTIDWRIHAGIIAAGGSGWILSEVFKDDLARDNCRWCASNRFDSGVRTLLLSDDTDLANTASNVLAFGVAPASALGLTALAAEHDGRGGNAIMDGLMVLEAMVLAADLNQGMKFLVERQRPYVAASDQPTVNAENNLSFYSGHTSFAFSLAAASGTIASVRGYRLAPLVWAVGMTTAAATGWLRMAADRHYASDVLIGAIAGSTIGVAVPMFLRNTSLEKLGAGGVTVMPTSGGATLAYVRAF